MEIIRAMKSTHNITTKRNYVINMMRNTRFRSDAGTFFVDNHYLREMSPHGRCPPDTFNSFKSVHTLFARIISFPGSVQSTNVFMILLPVVSLVITPLFRITCFTFFAFKDSTFLARSIICPTRCYVTPLTRVTRKILSETSFSRLLSCKDL